MFRQGDTFWIPSPENGIEHLYIVVSDLDKDCRKIVVVPLTTRESWTDETCTFHAGSHPAIKHDTCVDYRRAKILTAEALNCALSKRQIRKGASPMPARMLRDILDGANSTRYLPKECDRVLHDQGLID